MAKGNGLVTAISLQATVRGRPNSETHDAAIPVFEDEFAKSGDPRCLGAQLR